MGLEIRLIYKAHIEGGNAFVERVDCLTLLIYDAAGNYVRTITETNPDNLHDEFWRMKIDLTPGQYTLVTYGGMACDDASFNFVTEPAPGSKLTDIKVAMDPSVLTAPDGTRLHPLFYGRLEDITVSQDDLERRPVTVEMMKDTNNVRILLQNVSGEPVDDTDLEYVITDNRNSLFDWDNNLLPVEPFSYMPWAHGNCEYIFYPDEEGVISTAAYAEFSTSRFTPESEAVLTISHNGKEILSIPLIQYLLMLKSQEFASMEPQEFFDRESRWNVIFFLQNGKWLKTRFVVNDWTVRVNNITT